MCPRQYISENGKLMEPALFRKIVDEIAKHDVEAVVPFFRGESLLHPEFLDMISYLKEKSSAAIQLATNAQLLTDKISDRLLELEIDFISFSLDSIVAETYKKIRVGGTLEKAMQNISAFLDRKKSLAQDKPIVQVSATKCEHNEEEIPGFIEHWQDRVDRVRIYPQHSEDGKFGKLSNNASASQRERRPCKKPFADMVIYYNGNTAICNHDWQRPQKDSPGSVSNQSINQIWNSDLYKQIREKHIKLKYEGLSPCAHCDNWQEFDDKNGSVGKLISA